jgi:hypothetical protein
VTDFPVELGRNISARARDFAGIILPDEAASLEPAPHPDDFESDWGDSAETRRAIRAFDQKYRGMSVRSLGGPLKGEVRLGVNGARPFWRSGTGIAIFRCGDHPSIQCAIVASLDGRFGCSWSGEFTALFDSVELFIENAAAWGMVQGWEYVAVTDVPVNSVLAALDDMAVDVTASGELATWWTAADQVVVVQRHLNPARSVYPQVSVLARTPVAKDSTRRRLADVGMGPSAFDAAETFGQVPQLRTR